MSPLSTILLAWLLAAATMMVFWFWQRRSGDAGIVDAIWSFSVGALAIYFAIMGHGGQATRRILLAGLVLIWAVRLGTYILRRSKRLGEDGRYQTLKKQWGDRAQQKLLIFYQYQAIGALLFALPVYIAAFNPQPLGWGDLLAVLVWAISMGGEAISDWQLSRFRALPENRGKVCRDGLWYFSRHPNYFFEWLHWWAYLLFGLGAPWGWLNILGPVVMYLLITRVTGIPPTEAQALQSRGAAYAEYQRTTSPFIPWFPRSSSSKSVANSGG